MSKKVLVNLDLNGNSLLNPVFNPLSTPPANANPYYLYTSTANSDKGVMYINVGTYASPVWQAAGAVLSVNGQTGNVQTYKGAWAASTTYYVGDMVANGGNLYVCKTQHTSSSTFSDTNWIGIPPINHATSATTYGTGTGTNYGHVKLSDAVDGTSDTTGGTAATPKAVKSVKDAIPLASSTTPSMDGAAAVGTGTTWARADHVHPTDTSRAPVDHASTQTTYGVGNDSKYGHLKLSDATDGTSDTTGGTAATPKAVKSAYDLANAALPKTGGTMSGAIAMGNNKITGLANGTAATDAAAFGQIPVAATANQLMDGTAAVGTSAKWAKEDHVHPTDTTRAPLASPAFTGVPTAPTAANGTNTTQIATTAFVQNTLSYADAMIFKGTIGTGGTVTTLPATHEAGWTYKVITAGTYAGQTAEVGDLIICVKDGSAASDADWTVVQTNIDGAVTGPASSTDGHIATFDGASGKVIKDGYGVVTTVTDSDTDIPTSGAVNDMVNGLIDVVRGTIKTSATSVRVAYTGKFINAYALQGDASVITDMTVASNNVLFSVASAPSAPITCVVVCANAGELSNLTGTTWVIKETPETQTISPLSATLEVSIQGYPTAGDECYINFLYDTSGSHSFTSAIEITNGEEAIMWTNTGGWTDENSNPVSGAEYRTVTIHGGNDVINPSVIAWFKNNATQVI